MKRFQTAFFQRRHIYFQFGLFCLLASTVLSGCSSSTVDVSKMDTLSMVVRRVATGPDNAAPIIFQKTVHNAHLVQSVYQAITFLHQQTSSDTINCGVGFPPYEFIDFRFQQQKTLLAEATIEVISCYFWRVKAAATGDVSTYCCTPDEQWLAWKQDLGIPYFNPEGKPPGR